VTSRDRGGLLVLAACAIACHKPPPVDPANEAFHAAVVRFAETSKITQDLTYRDPRFDPILEALDRIPADSEPKPQALALAERIRGARALANSLEPGSDRLRAEAEASPTFEPQLRPPPNSTLKPVAPVEPQAPAPTQGTSPIATASARSPAKPLPSWYGDYFGSAEASQDAGPAPADATAAPDREVPPAPKRAAKAVDSVAPPPVFGLPGPAGSALQGRPGE